MGSFASSSGSARIKVRWVGGIRQSNTDSCPGPGSGFSCPPRHQSIIWGARDDPRMAACFPSISWLGMRPHRHYLFVPGRLDFPLHSRTRRDKRKMAEKEPHFAVDPDSTKQSGHHPGNRSKTLLSKSSTLAGFIRPQVAGFKPTDDTRSNFGKSIRKWRLGMAREGRGRGFAVEVKRTNDLPRKLMGAGS